MSIKELSEECDSEFSYDSNEDFDYDEEDEEIIRPSQQPNIIWTELLKKRKMVAWLPKFRAKIGPLNFTLESEKPINLFYLLFPEDLIEKLAKWTQKRAESRIDNEKRRDQRKLNGLNYYYQR